MLVDAKSESLVNVFTIRLVNHRLGKGFFYTASRLFDKESADGPDPKKIPLSIYVIPAAAEPHHRAQAATWAAKLATIRAGASKACIEFFLHAFFLEFGIFGCCSPLFQPSKCRSGRPASSARSLGPRLHQKCGLSRRLMPALRVE